MSGSISFAVEVAEAKDVAHRVKRFRLKSIDSEPLPAWAPGAHILITLRDEASTWRNAYSLMGSPSDRSSYQISVLHTQHSRGGSTHLHQAIEVGARLSISAPVNLFPLAALARKHVFIAGGIGITPLLPMMEQLHTRSVPFELHYTIRSKGYGAYVDEISQAYGDRVHIYETAGGSRPAIKPILVRQPLGTHLYVCGPEQMTEDVLTLGRGSRLAHQPPAQRAL